MKGMMVGESTNDHPLRLAFAGRLAKLFPPMCFLLIVVCCSTLELASVCAWHVSLWIWRESNLSLMSNAASRRLSPSLIIKPGSSMRAHIPSARLSNLPLFVVGDESALEGERVVEVVEVAVDILCLLKA
ncbi:hypothetical protein P691DRAFT_51783 [Macrolepiota fuliginosa MF-IS2]|uniref:Uncharacterized protein n=1 Tax=Macrolepiota fuliginosa MF-IS2 TaxID=1400762 RepID=A0A9P5XDZ0_9AGAR|nr:hypothetical protein P691DRAFT_51783 [Macrolepiota fuliginosa MF-IS2]